MNHFLDALDTRRIYTLPPQEWLPAQDVLLELGLSHCFWHVQRPRGEAVVVAVWDPLANDRAWARDTVYSLRMQHGLEDGGRG